MVKADERSILIKLVYPLALILTKETAVWS